MKVRSTLEGHRAAAAALTGFGGSLCANGPDVIKALHGPPEIEHRFPQIQKPMNTKTSNPEKTGLLKQSTNNESYHYHPYHVSRCLFVSTSWHFYTLCSKRHCRALFLMQCHRETSNERLWFCLLAPNCVKSNKTTVIQLFFFQFIKLITVCCFGHLDFQNEGIYEYLWHFLQCCKAMLILGHGYGRHSNSIEHVRIPLTT